MACPDGGGRVTDDDRVALNGQISRSSFYAGMRVLPKAEREAMFAVYA